MGRLDVLRSDLTSFRQFWRSIDTMTPEPPCPPPLPEGRIVNVPGRGEMLVREMAGKPGGPTILLLHGWTLGADLNWFTAYETLSEHGRVIAIDQRGHGRGIRSEEPFTLDAAADDAAALLEHLDAAPAVVVGYSMGGSVGLLQWRRHPGTVVGLVLQSTGLQWRRSAREHVLWAGMATVEFGLRFGTPSGLTARYLRQATEQRPDLEPYLPWLKAEVRRGDASDIAAAGRALSRFDARPFAGDVDVPVSVVVALHDRLIRPKKQRRLAAAIPDAEVIEVDAAHNGWMVRPEEIVEALGRGVDSVVERASPRREATSVAAVTRETKGNLHRVPPGADRTGGRP